MVEQFSADRKGLNLTSFAANFFNGVPSSRSVLYHSLQLRTK